MTVLVLRRSGTGRGQSGERVVGAGFQGQPAGRDEGVLSQGEVVGAIGRGGGGGGGSLGSGWEEVGVERRELDGEGWRKRRTGGRKRMVHTRGKGEVKECGERIKEERGVVAGEVAVVGH